jgi:hypothetical protein
MVPACMRAYYDFLSKEGWKTDLHRISADPIIFKEVFVFRITKVLYVVKEWHQPRSPQTALLGKKRHHNLDFLAFLYYSQTSD